MRTIQITLHNIRRSPALSARIRDLGERLENHWSEMIHCRVAVAQERGPGAGSRLFTVTVNVRLPGRDLVASAQNREDVYAALREAFDVMRRDLNEAAPMRRPVGRPPSAKPSSTKSTAEVPS
ncbi:MAG TPA: HPF/RaiA family ribosome-associated protein [Usitatibacter sp.]|nr:HPF/RaiA family ribosome-associated protein [Usitatibacter sp.]